MVHTELLLADLELVETRIEKLEKQVNKPSKTQGQDKVELGLQLKLQAASGARLMPMLNPPLRREMTG